MSNVPEIRFEGFTAAWEQRKLEDGVKKVGDGIHGTPTYDDNGEVAFINGNNLVNGKIVITSQTKHVNDTQKTIHDNNLNTDTILMSINGTIGNLAWYNGENIMLGKSAAYIKAGDFDKAFIYALLQTSGVKKFFLDNLTGTTIKNLGLKTIRETPVKSPERAEQTAIGEFFRALDENITLNKQKLDGLKQLKKGYLQQMFPQTRETVPKIRLKGFSEPWQMCKLGDVAKIVGGGTPDTNTPEYWGGEIDWYTPAEIGEQFYVNDSQRKITSLGLQKSSAVMLPVGTVLFTSRAGIGNTAILEKAGATNQGFQSIVPNKSELDSYFIFSKTRELKRYGEAVGAGSTFIEVSGKQMAVMPLLIPTLPEQIAIGNFFRNLDNQIATQSQKVEQLKQLKAAYLQKMFV